MLKEARVIHSIDDFAAAVPNSVGFRVVERGSCRCGIFGHSAADHSGLGGDPYTTLRGEVPITLHLKAISLAFAILHITLW